MIANLILSALVATSLFSNAHASGPLIPSVGTVLNPSFEMSTPTMTSQGLKPLPTHWVQSGSGTDFNPTVVITDEEYHTNGHSVVFLPRSQTNIGGTDTLYVAEIYQQIDIIERGQELTLKWWGKAGSAVNPTLSGKYNFTISYDHDEHGESVLLQPTYTVGTGTSAHRGFWEYTATWTAPEQHHHEGAYLTITFSTRESNVYYYLDDISLSAPFIIGDPQFVGLRGQSYQVHGIDGAVYNLITSPSTQVNAQFKFLSEGKCPVFDGIPDTNCWAHPGSYLGSIGVQEIVNGKLHQVTLVSGPAEQGFASILVDGEALDVDKTVDDTDAFSVTRTSSHRVLVQTSQFLFTFDNSDMFINQAVSTRVAMSKLSSHGLFGQTHQRKVYSTPLKYIQGEVDDYMVEENNLSAHHSSTTNSKLKVVQTLRGLSKRCMSEQHV